MTREKEAKATSAQVRPDNAAGAARTLERLERLVGAFADELGRLEESLEALSDELLRLKGDEDAGPRNLH